MVRFRRPSVRIIPSPVFESTSPVLIPVDLLLADSLADRDSNRLANLFLKRFTKPTSTLLDTISKPKHDPIDILSSSSTNIHIDGHPPIQYGPLQRRPRHIPIVTPDYASPYGPPLKTPTSSHWSSISDLSSSSSASASADATQDTASSKSREKETSSLFESTRTAMNSSQVSLATSESGLDSVASSFHQSQSQSNLASYGMQQQNAATANVSGLVCNVHRTTGQEPRPLVGATTTILGDKLYVFGGRVYTKDQPHLSSSLYELDLIRRHWTKLEAIGDIPAPRYFHSVCPLGDTKLVCYGGMSPTSRSPTTGTAESQAQPDVAVMADIHVYDVPTNKWTLIQPLGPENPQGRYAHCATVLPSSAVFATAESHTSAIHLNPSSMNPHSGTIGVQIDGTGGAEMVVVGGQDSNNNYIQQISVFNLRNLRWTSSTPYDRNCGAYKSMVTSLPNINAQKIGQGMVLEEGLEQQSGTAMLIYSNYNFLDVRLEMQVRTPDGRLEEKTMNGSISPPGLRFPNGGVINGHFVISGTYLTSSKHEYALWALDLKTLTWAMIDTSGTVFGQGSWNRGILWNRRNSYVILGHRRRNLVEDYNHRRINFAHLCLVELEAYGLYDNPRRNNPCSAYISNSAPAIPMSLQQDLSSRTAGGRSISAIAEQLGHTALYVHELCDMEIITQDGGRVPCNSRILAHRWGPFFENLVLDSAPSLENIAASDTTTLRPSMSSRAASRISALTITPSTNGFKEGGMDSRSQSRMTQRTLVELPDTSTVSAAARGRVLYLPHTTVTVNLMLHFLYTSSLPPPHSSLCSPHTLCSLLQMARPYQIDGLQEATIERLHEVLDGRNAAAVFNAAAMAAGGGRATGSAGLGTLETLERRESAATTIAASGGRRSSVLADDFGARRGHGRTKSSDSTSTATSATSATESTTASQTDEESPSIEHTAGSRRDRPVWSGETSSVIALQKRGLRGLMEGRRMRERSHTGE